LAAIAAVYLGFLGRRITADDLMHAGDTAAAERDGAHAERLYRKTLDIVPDHGPALRALGQLYFEQGRFPEAIDVLGKARNHAAPHPSILLLLAYADTALGRPEQGAELARRAIQCEPLAPNSHVCLAASLAAQRENRAALRSLARGVELGFDNAAWLRTAPVFAALRQDSRFDTIARQAGRIQRVGSDSDLAPLRVVEDHDRD